MKAKDGGCLQNIKTFKKWKRVAPSSIVDFFRVGTNYSKERSCSNKFRRGFGATCL